MRSTRKMSLVVGDSASLRCESLGYPTPNLVWYHDDAVLDVLVTWTLELDHVTVQDGGMYTCIVYNDAGVISFRYNITVTSLFVWCFVIFAARRSVFARHFLWRHGRLSVTLCICLCVCHVDILCPND